jgi:hypothetical protein
VLSCARTFAGATADIPTHMLRINTRENKCLNELKCINLPPKLAPALRIVATCPMNFNTRLMREKRAKLGIFRHWTEKRRNGAAISEFLFTTVSKLVKINGRAGMPELVIPNPTQDQV